MHDIWAAMLFCKKKLGMEVQKKGVRNAGEEMHN